MPVIIGDVNVNGKIDVSDIIYLKRFLAGAEISIDINRGDLNADGKITAVDCTLLQRKFVGSAA